jgi:hypothetical protein
MRKTMVAHSRGVPPIVVATPNRTPAMATRRRPPQPELASFESDLDRQLDDLDDLDDDDDFEPLDDEDDFDLLDDLGAFDELERLGGYSESTAIEDPTAD